MTYRLCSKGPLRARAAAALVLGLLGAGTPSCSQTPVIVPVRSMERPKDLALICLEVVGTGSTRGAPIEKCRTNGKGEAIDETGKVVDGGPDYRLHAVVTQLARGELAVVDLGRTYNDVRDGLGLVKADPRTPGFNFLPVSQAPTAVAADPAGKAVFVASGHDPRVDIIPAELLRGPIDAHWYTASVPWPHLDFDLRTEGRPAHLAIERNGGKNDRLYVVLPDAMPLPKVAVFDLSVSALAPARVGDLLPSLTKAPALPVAPRVCLDAAGVAKEPRCLDGGSPPTLGPCPPPARNGPAWWDAFETSAGPVCGPLSSTPAAPVAVESALPTTFHFGPATLEAGKLFVADDAAPYIHVFDVANGGGTEVARLDIGSTTGQVAVSPIVPDEVTWDNADALEVCEVKGWVGDGLDHGADDALVKSKLGGRCRAHRYVYAVDRQNADDGDGTLAVIDLPVIKRKDGGDDLDFSAAALQQPFACDSPTFPIRRIPLGGFGIGGANQVPVKQVTFVTYDPPSTTGDLTGVRCRPNSGRTALSGVDAATYALRADAAAGWSASQYGSGSARYLRGVFGLAMLTSGVVVPIALDDYDSLCRGQLPTAAGASGANEVDFANLVRRHHPRASRLYTSDQRVPPTAPIEGRKVVSLSTSSEFRPKLTILGPTAEGARSPTQVVDSLFALLGEFWTLTYEGEVPGFGTTVGTFTEEGGEVVLLDPSGGICRKGVEADAASATNDYLQILDEPCAIAGSCNAAQQAKCLTTFGPLDDQDLRNPTSLRDVAIKSLKDDRLVLDLSSAKLAELKACFPGATKYTVRARGAWTVVGNVSGYLHRHILDPKSSDHSCKLDETKSSLVRGRAREVPAAPSGTNACSTYLNPQIGFYIVAGAVATPRDMTFQFGNRQVFNPLIVNIGSMPTAIAPLSHYRAGVDVLGWGGFATVDANDRGLSVFSLATDLTTARSAN